MSAYRIQRLLYKKRDKYIADILFKVDSDVYIRLKVLQDQFNKCLSYVHRLWTRKEKEIAIVTHSGFLFHTLKEFGNDCNPSMRKEICKQ